MRRALPGVLGGLILLLAPGGTAAAALLEPVSVTATAPETVTAGSPFRLEIAVEAEAGALDIAAAPLTLGVKLAPECGGSLAGTAGPAVLEKTLPNPVAGTPYAQTVTGQVTATGTGTEVVCAFLQDAQERQFATDTQEEVAVTPAGATDAHQCTAATMQSKVAKRKLTRLEGRIKKVKGKVRHAKGAHRRALVRKLHKLRAHERKAKKRRKAGAHQVAAVCS